MLRLYSVLFLTFIIEFIVTYGFFPNVHGNFMNHGSKHVKDN